MARYLYACPLSVSLVHQLPDQPAVGLVSLITLGGDGFESPRAAIQWRIDLASDASAGSNQISVTFDPVWTAVVNYVGVQVTGAGAFVGHRFALGPGPASLDNILHTGTLQIGPTGFPGVAGWTPPAIVLQAKDSPIDPALPNVQSVLDNTDGETHRFKGQAYLFEKEAVFKVGIEKMLEGLVRWSEFHQA